VGVCDHAARAQIAKEMENVVVMVAAPRSSATVVNVALTAAG